MAVTKTLIRPNYTSLLPKLLTNYNGNDIEQGNPDLEPTRSWNYDLYASFYNPIFGLFTAGFFYKQIENTEAEVDRFIESEEKATSVGLPLYYYEDYSYIGKLVTRPENMPESTVKGFELDLQTNFAFLPGFWKGFVLNINYSRLWSETHYPLFFVHQVEIPQPPFFVTEYENSTRSNRMLQQASDLLNISVGYDIGGFSARLSMSYQGSSLRKSGSQEELDSWREAFTRWDFSIRQKLSESFSLLANGANLTNQHDGTYYVFDPRPLSLHYYGAMYELGIEFNF